MNHSSPTRRSILKGLAAGALALPAWSRRAKGQAGKPPEAASLVMVFLNRGPSGLFNSADSFLQNGQFGVTPGNVRAVGNGLVVDRESFGSLPDVALGHMASINFKHGLYRHELARAALLQTGDRSNLLM